MDRVNTLKAIPIPSEVGKRNNTFIVHELEDVGSFSKIGIDMGLGFRHSHDCKDFSETTWNWDIFFFRSYGI